MAARAEPRSRPEPAPPPGIIARLVAAGANHHTAGQDFRDRLFTENEPGAVLDCLEGLGLDEGLALATCDRVEMWALDADPEAAGARIRAALAERAGASTDETADLVFVEVGRAALEHLFGVAAALESRVIGEPEVLGQVKAAHRRASERGLAGPDIGRVMAAAYAAAKRVRTETPLGERPVSIAAAAVEVAREVLGRFEGSAALVIGGAEIGVLVAERLKAAGLKDIRVADPVAARAEALAARLGGRPLAFERVPGALAGADIVLSGLGARVPPVGADAVAAALKARRYRPMFLLDAAAPPDVEPAVAELDEAYLFDLGDLERLALDGRERRSEAAAAARDIVAREAAAFVEAEAGRGAGDAVARLRRHFEETRAALLAEQPGLTAEEATRLLVARLLHAPSRALRDRAARSGAEAGSPPEIELIARLFDPFDPEAADAGGGERPDRDKKETEK